MRTQLKQRNAVLLIVSALLLFALPITRPVDHAPNLDVPAVSPEVGTPVSGVRDTGLWSVKNAMRMEPVIDSQLEGRADNVPILADPTLALLPTVRLDLQANSGGHGSNEAERNSVYRAYLFQRKAVQVSGTQRLWRGHRDDLALAPSLPASGSWDTVFFEPASDLGFVNAIVAPDLRVTQMLDMDKRVQFGASGRGDSAVSEPVAGSPSRHVVVLHPPNDLSLADAELRTNGTRGQTLGEVQIFEDFSGWAHVSNIAGAGV